MANKPFRFGVQIASLPAEGWKERVLELEKLGYSSALFPDHFAPQWDPFVGPAAIAAITERMNVGQLVLGVDYRHPVIVGRAAATLSALSGGRCELGLGAGWMLSDYEQAGMECDSAGARVRKVDEALTIIRSMWANEHTNFEGEFYRATDLPRAVKATGFVEPRIMVGGGRPKILAVAGRHADIIGVNPSLHEGKVTAQTAADIAPERIAEKIEWVRAGVEEAGRDFDALEFNTLAFVVAITDDPGPIREAVSQQTGMTLAQVADCPLFLTGSPAEIRDTLEARRERFGINYVIIQRQSSALVRQFAEAVVEPLSGK